MRYARRPRRPRYSLGALLMTHLPLFDDSWPDWIVLIKKLVHTPQAKKWCALPYPNHPKGCPKDVKKCSRGGYYITDVLDLQQPHYFIYSEFNLAAHMARMLRRHPHWTERQQRNVLYWQSASRKQLKDRVTTALRLTRCGSVTTCPESYGVNVYATARNSGLILEPIKTLKTCRHIALIGFKGRV